MNNLLTKQTPARARETDESFSALVAYEDTITRDRAMQICDQLVQRLWPEVEFNLSWWRFDFLRDTDMAEVAAKEAIDSDLILFSAHGGRELPPFVTEWIETWQTCRGLREGVLAAMIGTGADQFKGLTPIHVYLSEVAQRANLDYLPQVMDAPLGDLEASIEMITGRAEKVTSLLDNILNRPQIPSRWGINE